MIHQDVEANKKTKKFRVNIEISDIEEIFSDSIESSINAVIDRYDILTLVIKEINQLEENHVGGMFANEHDPNTLKSFMMFSMEDSDSIIEVSWGPIVNTINILVYDQKNPNDPKAPSNIHAEFKITIPHEDTPKMLGYRDKNPLAIELDDRLQRMIDNYTVDIMEINLPPEEKEDKKE